MGGAGSAITTLTWSGRQSEAARKAAMLKDTPLGLLMSDSDLENFTRYFAEHKLQPHQQVTTRAGELWLVADGEVQVCVIRPGLDSVTGDQALRLTTKRKGDFICSPSVQRMLSGKGDGEATPSKASKDLSMVLDTTFVDSLYGAILLKLDRKKYDKLLQELVSNGGHQHPGSAPEDDGNHTLTMEALKRVVESNILDYLKNVPFLAKVPLSKLMVLSEMCNYDFKRKNNVVCREGESDSGIFIVLDGGLVVEVQGQDGTSVELARLGPGSYFGEMTAILRMRRSASVRATQDTLLVTVKRHDFRSFLQILPEVKEAVEQDVKHNILVKRCRLNNPFFPRLLNQQDVGETELQNRLFNMLMSNMSVVDVDAGVVLIGEGEEPAYVFYVVEGQLRLARRDQPVSSDQLVGTSGMVAERAVLMREPIAYSVIVATDSVLLQLPTKAFHEYVRANPEAEAFLHLRVFGQSTTLKRFLAYGPAYQAFRRRLSEEVALENLDFIDGVKVFEALLNAEVPDIDAVNSQAKELFTTFLDNQCPQPINVPDSLRSKALHARDAIGFPKAASTFTRLEEIVDYLAALAIMFTECRVEIMLLMEKDNFGRFKHSAALEELLKSVNEIMPGDSSPHDTRVLSTTSSSPSSKSSPRFGAVTVFTHTNDHTTKSSPSTKVKASKVAPSPV